ncbi:helix-turn-helix transcriptional regulator [Streptomyces sp. GMY02]|nr:helix-turn-helix transcriptional regulator [Streptomyces sp. GMY02]
MGADLSAAEACNASCGRGPRRTRGDGSARGTCGPSAAGPARAARRHVTGVSRATGISPSTLSRIETGRRKPNLEARPFSQTNYCF